MNSSLVQTKKIYSVSELTREIRLLLEGAFPKAWVEGQVSNFRMHSSGHCYFSLKDSESILNCILFKNNSYNIKFKLEDGMSLICYGRISVYNKTGQYQLYVEEIEPKGIGSLQLAFNQLKEKLSQEGLFDSSHKIPIPYLPERIGIITSPTGAAIMDMIHIIQRRFPNMHIILHPVNVQGETASQGIAEAIGLFNELRNVDVLIVGRGGGSLEDLWAFNEETMARAIYKSELPIISAVGHEIDYTIADFVADLRAPTPSAAAELVVPVKQDLLRHIESLKQALKMALVRRIDVLKKQLDGIMQHYAFRQPHFLIEQYQQRIDEYSDGLLQSLRHLISIKLEKLTGATQRLKILNPAAILSRGYSITMTYPEGKIIKSKQSVKKGAKIKTRLAEGEIISRIE